MNIPEILVANGTGAVLVSFLLLLRVRGESKNSVGTELFCRILVVMLLAQATETISFLLDGVPGAASRFWLYLTKPSAPALPCAWAMRGVCMWTSGSTAAPDACAEGICCWARRCWRF